MQLSIGEEVSRIPYAHTWAEGSLHAQKGFDETSRAYHTIKQRNNAAGQFRRHGWIVTLYEKQPCWCGLPNRLH